MDNTTISSPVTADPAQADDKMQAAAVAGKFKSVDALAEAYSNLEAEFTRRSQRLRELERAVKEAGPAQDAASPQPSPQPSEPSDAPLSAAAEPDEEVKARIIAEYLAAAAKNKSVPIITGGVNVAAQRRTPSTVREAGELARQFLRGGRT